MKNARIYTGLSVALAVVLGAGLFSVASAQTPGGTATPSQQTTSPHVTRVAGRVQSVNANGLVLANGSRSVTVNVSANTWVLSDKGGKCDEASLNDIQTGKAAEVAGMTTSTANTVDARVVAQGNCVRLLANKLNGNGNANALDRLKAVLNHSAQGTVKSVSGNNIVLTNRAGKDVNLVTTANTLVFNNGFQPVSSLKVGDKVTVFGRPDKAQQGTGTPASTRTLTAWALRVDTASTQMMVGRVEKVDGNTVTVRTPANRTGLALTLDASTGYRMLTVSNQQITVANASQTDLKVGSNLVFEAARSADGKSTTAKAIVIVPSDLGNVTR